MNRKNVIFWVVIISLLILSSFFTNSTLIINIFNNSLSSETLRFTGDSNITRYLNIDRYVVVNNATMNFSSFRENYYEIYYNDTELNSEFFGQGSFIQINNNGSSIDENWNGSSMNFTQNENCISSCPEIQIGYLRENFTIPTNSPLVNLTLNQKYGFTIRDKATGSLMNYNLSCITDSETLSNLKTGFLDAGIGNAGYNENYTINISIPSNCVNNNLIRIDTRFSFILNHGTKIAGNLYETQLLQFNNSNINGSYLEIGSIDGVYEWATGSNLAIRNDTELSGVGGSDAYDENWTTFITSSPIFEVKENWSISSDFEGLNWTIKGRSSDSTEPFLNGSCYNFSSTDWVSIFNLSFNQPIANRTYDLPNGCVSGGLIRTRVGGYTADFVGDRYYESLIEYIDGTAVTNITLFNNTGGVKTNGFSSKLNSILPSCNCNGCSIINTTTCDIPFLLHSSSNGLLNYNGLSVNYSLLMPSVVNDRCIQCGYGNTSYIEVNITDGNSLSISYVNFSVFLGNGSTLLNNDNGTIISGNSSNNVGQIWRSNNFTIAFYVDNYKHWFWNITASNNVTHTNQSNGTFTITTNPLLNLTSPIHGQSLGSMTFTINATTQFSNLSGNCFYSLQYTANEIYEIQNSSISCSSQEITTSLGTSYYLWFWANNSHNNLNFTKITISTPTGQQVGSGGGGGSSSSGVSPTKTSEESFECNKSKWRLKPSFFETFYLQKANRTQFFEIVNYGTKDLDLKLKCVDTSDNATANICNYVGLSHESITVKPNALQPQLLNFTVEVPPNAQFGDRFFFYISVDDSTTCNFLIYSGNTISYLGIFAKLVTSLGIAIFLAIFTVTLLLSILTYSFLENGLLLFFLIFLSLFLALLGVYLV